MEHSSFLHAQKVTKEFGNDKEIWISSYTHVSTGKDGSCRFRPMVSSPHINSTSIQEVKFIFLLPKIEDNIVRMMKQNHTKRVYFSFFNTLNVTGELEIQSLG